MNLIAVLIFTTLVTQISGVFWGDLRLKFGPGPSDKHFERQPRLVSDAVAQGWTKLSLSCENDGKFFGFRYKLYDDTIYLLFDKNGAIAGIQATLPHDEVIEPGYGFRYDLEPMFQNETLNGKAFVILTAYLVPPESICTTGRTESDVLLNGTGTGLWFQNGPTPSSLITVSQTRSEAASVGWTNCECFSGMGLHNFWKIEEWQQYNCTRILPAQILFTLDGEMLGFVFQIFASTSSPRFEKPQTQGIYAIIGRSRTPQCIVNVNENFGTTSLHIYLVDKPWDFKCPT